jgi:hypothetical protein
VVGCGLFPEETSENGPELDAGNFAIECFENISKRGKMLNLPIYFKDWML